MPLLNVHPDYQGKSLARRILTRMVDRAAELGYHLMTIGTWSGNLTSVPLYKKVGFFWVPDTSVFMENFLPLIRQMGVAQAYFQEHDWYTTFRRELRQVEDDQRHGEMKVYTYRWQEGGDSLTVLIDRQSKAPTGVETPSLAAYAELGEIEPAHGLTYPIRWRVLNKRAEPVDVSILAGGDPGIDISGQHTFRLQGGQEQVVEGRFSVSPDIEPVKKDWPAPGVKTVLVVGGDVIELSSGVRPRPAVAVSLEPIYPVLLPGRPQTLHVQLHNNLGRPVGGVVSLAPQVGLAGDWPELRHDFEIEGQGYAGLPLTVTCDRDGALPLRFNTLVETDDAADSKQPQQFRGRPQRIPLFSLPPGGLAADVGPSDEGDVIIVQNEFFRLRCRPEGGRCAVWHRGLERPLTSVREVLGPPFVPSELRYKPYDLSLEEENGHSRWHLAPAYHGGVVGWYTGESPINHLYSPFPEEDGGSMGWLKPWYGGIRPLLTPSDHEDKGWTGKLHEEKFSARVCEQSDGWGLVWRGARLSADVQRPAFRGLRTEIDYLSLGRSNLLKLVYRLINRTDAYRRVSAAVFVFCQVDGRWDNGTLFGDGVQLKRTPVMGWPSVGHWGAVSNPDSGRTLVMVAKTPQAWLGLSDWGQDGGHLLGQAHLLLAPNGCEELAFYLALADSPDAARRYAALAQ